MPNIQIKIISKHQENRILMLLIDKNSEDILSRSEIMGRQEEMEKFTMHELPAFRYI
jgi:hypothetical protein